MRLIFGVSLLCGLSLPLQSAFGQASNNNIARIGVRVSSGAPGKTVAGVVVGVDPNGQAITDLDPSHLQATLDGRPVQLSLVGGRPSIALAAAFLLDSSAAPQVRDAAANALAAGVQGIDVNRDSVSIVSTSAPTSWEQAPFSTSVDDLAKALNQFIQAEPNDALVSLEQVSGVLRALAVQPKETKVLVLFTNRPLASGGTINATLGTVRGFAVENGLQVSIIALPGAGGQGPAEALAESTPGGRVEYVLDATNRSDIARRLGLLLAPALGARRFEFPSPGDGSHSLTITAPGVVLPAAATFVVAGRLVPVSSLETSSGPLAAGTEIKEPLWIQARPAEANVPIDGVEWSVDGKATLVTGEPYSFLLDPEVLGDGPHDVTARIMSQGRAGPFFPTTTVYVPTDALRVARGALRTWGIIGALVIVNALFVYFLFRGRRFTSGGRLTTEFPPTLRLKNSPMIAPERIVFPDKGKLRIGYHPPYMDNTVGSREFSKLPYQDVRGDTDVVRDLSRHVACIWRDPKTNDCYIQLGWNGPGEPIVPRPQSVVFHMGMERDATAQPFRLAHLDEVRLSSGVTYVFSQVGLRDKDTDQAKKLRADRERLVEGQSSASQGAAVRVSEAARGHGLGDEELVEGR